MTRKNYCGNLLWQSILTLSAPGKKLSLSDIKSVDRSQWKKKGIVKLLLADNSRVTLDCWHHLGVKDFEKLLPAQSQGAER